VVGAPPSVVFPRLLAHDPARFYPRSGVLPGVVDVRDQSGGWDAAGATRLLVLSDGGTVTETLRVVAAPLFAYDLSRFTGFFGRLVASGSSEWRVAEHPEGSRIEWTYTFTAKPGWGFVVAAIMRLAWARYMRRVLPAIAAATG
jgi:hypothetical protein